MATTFPTPLDVLDLLLLRVAKARRGEFQGDEADYYQGFFNEEDLAKYTQDVRSEWRYSNLRRIFDQTFGGGTARVADIGCGLGISRLFLPATADYIGIEYSAATLELASRIHREHGESYLVGGFPDLPLAGGSIDFCICHEVVEHVADDRRALAELYRVVKPGGYLLISVPRGYYWSDYRRLMGHFRHYSGPAISRLLVEQGFVVVKRFSQFPTFWRLYFYVYVGFLACQKLIRKTVQPDYSFYRSRGYRKLARWIMRHLPARLREDDPGSTYLLCRKPEAVP